MNIKKLTAKIVSKPGFWALNHKHYGLVLKIAQFGLFFMDHEYLRDIELSAENRIWEKKHGLN